MVAYFESFAGPRWEAMSRTLAQSSQPCHFQGGLEGGRGSDHSSMPRDHGKSLGGDCQALARKVRLLFVEVNRLVISLRTLQHTLTTALALTAFCYFAERTTPSRTIGIHPCVARLKNTSPRNGISPCVTWHLALASDRIQALFLFLDSCQENHNQQ
jgi:hypothetical protein